MSSWKFPGRDSKDSAVVDDVLEMGETFEINGSRSRKGNEDEDSDSEYKLDDIRASDDVIARTPARPEVAPKAEPEVDSSEPEEEESPEIRMEQDDVRAKEGHRLTLKCHVSGKPKPKVKWRRGLLRFCRARTFYNYRSASTFSSADGETLFSTKLQRQVVVGDVATLTFESLEPAHSGVYECAAQNCAGSAAATASITVKRECVYMLFCNFIPYLLV